MLRAFILPLDEWEFTTSMIHTCMKDLRLGFERNIQVFEMRAHELTMTKIWYEEDLSLMRWWSWIACFHFIFHLYLQSPFSLSSSSLFLPSREREEGEKWKSERSWGCFSWEVTLQFCAYDRWGPEVSGGQLIFLSLLLFSLLADGPLNLPDCLVDLWFWEINPSTWGFGIGAMFTFQGVISWPNSIWC